MKATSILLVSLILATPALAEFDQQEELRVIDATTKYLVEHPFPYYRHHWKVIVASDSRLRFQPLFVPSSREPSQSSSAIPRPASAELLQP